MEKDIKPPIKTLEDLNKAILALSEERSREIKKIECEIDSLYDLPSSHKIDEEIKELGKKIDNLSASYYIKVNELKKYLKLSKEKEIIFFDSQTIKTPEFLFISARMRKSQRN
ncbi:MAG TPA: hypothetical protein VMR49_00675 [Candidatus Paceibacterota bacterium]|nr:hypothetical protein [Candidatus Paceibacterota bacterium]